MLSPQDRRLFLDLLQPPTLDDDGIGPYRLDYALGTTYSLDLVALLSAPVAFAFQDWQDAQGRPVTDPVALLRAVREYADRICLFCETGRILVPKVYRQLLVNLEESIHQVRAPHGGVFHPKVWILRYVGKEDESQVLYRFLCLSRNMTFDRSWDTLLSLEGKLRGRVRVRNRPAADFVSALEGFCLSPLNAAWRERIAQTADELLRVDFQAPDPFDVDEFRFHPLGFGKYTKRPFPERADQLLVISPFVDDGCLTEFGEYTGPKQLISRGDSLACLNPDTLAHFEKVWTLDDNAEPEPDEASEDATNPVTDEDATTAVASPAVESLSGLHAKLYVADAGRQAIVFTGSANATRAAGYSNVEFLVELTGPKGKVGVDALLGSSAPDRPKQAECLSDLLVPYREQEQPSETELERRKFEHDVERVIRQLSSAAPRLHCEAIGEQEVYRLTIRANHGVTEIPDGISLRARLLSHAEHSAVALTSAEQDWAVFPTVSFESLTPFVVFEASLAGTKHVVRFLLKLDLVGAPSNRQERVLKSILSDRQKVLRFLLLLLSDEGAAGFTSIIDDSDEPSKRKSGSLFGDASLFESLVRALDRDPQRIDQIARIIDDLRKLPEGDTLLPEQLDDIWQPIWAVRQSQSRPSPSSTPQSFGEKTPAANEADAASISTVASKSAAASSSPNDTVVPTTKEAR